MDLVKTLRAHPLMAGIEVLDWRVAGKGTPAFVGVMNHHTVSRSTSGRYPSKTVVTKGRPDVSGPLCNILGARDGGSIAIITDDEANHAGLGDSNVTVKAKANRPAGGKPGPDQRNADGRHWWLGIEWENDGTGEPWSARMLETMYRTNAALCSIFGWDPMTRVVQHSEWSRRKIDCAFIRPALSYDEFRRNIAAVLTANRAPQTPEEDVPYLDWPEKDRKALVADIRVALLYPLTGSQPKHPENDDEWTNLGDLASLIKGE